MVRIVENIFGTALNPQTNQTENIRSFTISNDNNASFEVITLGATITKLNMPDKDGKIKDVVLGYDSVAGYQTASNPYIGCTVGRVCSRIGNGKFTLNGKVYEVGKNFLGKHYLHGGIVGFNKLHWEIPAKQPTNGITLSVLSPEGHEGFPGNVRAFLHFTLTEDNEFGMHFEATTDAATPVNLTNHTYFNLAGHETGKQGLLAHEVTIKASRMTEKDADTVPTGKFLNVSGGYDLRQWRNVGTGMKEIEPAPGYDDNYVFDVTPGKMNSVAKIRHPPTGLCMEVITDERCMHFYCAHNMPNVSAGEPSTIIGKNGVNYEKHGSFCMETSGYPDAVNHPEFDSVILLPGEQYSHKVVYKFTSEQC